MANPFWQEKVVQVGDLDVLVLRIKWNLRGWQVEARRAAPPGAGTYLHSDGQWYVRPFERTAKRAIYVAFPEARGTWDGEVLSEGSPE